MLVLIISLLGATFIDQNQCYQSVDASGGFRIYDGCVGNVAVLMRIVLVVLISISLASYFFEKIFSVYIQLTAQFFIVAFYLLIFVSNLKGIQAMETPQYTLEEIFSDITLIDIAVIFIAIYLLFQSFKTIIFNKLK